MIDGKAIVWLLVILSALLAPSIGAAPAGTKIDFSSLDASQPYKVSGTLYLPETGRSPCPAVVLVHGTAGIDSRGTFYREAILGAGIALFEVDFKTGIYSSALDRPKPEFFLPLVFAALKELRRLPVIDSMRIAIMGFSMGGGIALRAALEANRKAWMEDEKGFAAFATFYPVCKPFIKKLEESGGKLTDAPMIIFYGSEDSYGEGKAVPELKRLLAKKYNFDVTTVEYAGASHGFNRNAPTLSYPDPAANGGMGTMAWNENAANDSVIKLVAFLQQFLNGK
jgi:dienelactone hydrolase